MKHHYTMKISTRLGRTRYKEQFLFLYRCEGTFLFRTSALHTRMMVWIADILQSNKKKTLWSERNVQEHGTFY